MENNEKIKTIVENLENKDFTIYFYCMDTKGNPKAAIANIYDVAKNLMSLGYKACILHDDDTYYENHPIGWLGESYRDIPHNSLKSNAPTIKPEDFVVVPEVFSNIMDAIQKQNFPSKNIVLCQSPDYIFELLQPNMTWGVYGFNDVIVTSEGVGSYVKSVFPSVNTHVVSPVIASEFQSPTELKKPTVALLTRDQSDTAKILKTFIIQNPLVRWVHINPLNGLTREEFADTLKNSSVAVWVDDIAGFGTFPLEAIECDTPVIAKIPSHIPDWAIVDNDGKKELTKAVIWTDDVREIPNLISELVIANLEDSVPEALLSEMKSLKGKFTNDRQVSEVKNVFEKLVQNRIGEFNEILNKTK